MSYIRASSEFPNYDRNRIYKFGDKITFENTTRWICVLDAAAGESPKRNPNKWLLQSSSVFPLSLVDFNAPTTEYSVTTSTANGIQTINLLWLTQGAYTVLASPQDGTIGVPTFQKLNLLSLATSGAVLGDVVTFDGTNWVAQAGGGGGGITSINGQTAAAQLLTRVNDTNVTMTISQVLTNENRMTLGWTGTLADARITSAATWNAKVGSVNLTSTGGTVTLTDNTVGTAVDWNLEVPLTATQVAYGSGTNLITSIADFYYDTTNLLFNVGFAGSNFLTLDQTSNIYKIGDLNTSLNGCQLIIDDANGLLGLYGASSSMTIQDAGVYSIQLTNSSIGSNETGAFEQFNVVQNSEDIIHYEGLAVQSLWLGKYSTGNATHIKINDTSQNYLFNKLYATASGASPLMVTVSSAGVLGAQAIPGGGSAALTATYIGYGSGANVLTGDAGFLKTAAKVTITNDGTGSLGSLYITKGDAVRQYIVLHEDAGNPDAAYLTFKSTGGNAIAMGAEFSAGAPTKYVFTDPSAVILASIDVTTGDLLVTNLAGVGTRMVTASATGVLATAAVPTGTVTNFSAGDLSPLFTTTEATTTTTPALSFALTNAAAYTVFGNNTSGAAAPAYFTPTLASALFQNQGTTTTVLHGNAAGNPSWSAVSLTADVSGTLPAANGGTAIDTSASTGVAQVAAGTWSVSTALANGTTATTQTALDNSTQIATTAYVDASYKLTYDFTGGIMSPNDAITYYIGAGFAQNPSTVAARREWKIPYACTLIGASISIFVGTTLATTETFSIWARINNTTDVLLTNAAQANTVNNMYAITGLSTAIAANDTVEVKFTTPTWVTNPTNWIVSVKLIFK